MGGYTSLNGYVEVYVGGAWGAVCSNGLFNMAAADVACRQLGLSFANTVNNLPRDSGPGMNGTLLYLMSNVQCNGTEARLQDCGYFQGGVPDNNLCNQDASECLLILSCFYECLSDLLIISPQVCPVKRCPHRRLLPPLSLHLPPYHLTRQIRVGQPDGSWC